MAFVPHWPIYHAYKMNIRHSSLEMMKKALNSLGNPELSLDKIFHVTGTNGKGSVSTYIANMIRSAGCKVNLYRSPSIHNCNEMINLNGIDISDDELRFHIEEIRIICEKNNIQLNMFDVMTVAMLLAFSKSKADVNVIEVGMGGIFDSTNVFDQNAPTCSILTSIHIDHAKFLGSDITSILRHKMGIIKPDSLCISVNLEEKNSQILRQYCNSINTKVYIMNEDFFVHDNSNNLVIKIPHSNDIEISKPTMRGVHQCINASLATMAVYLVFELNSKYN
jgi:dihydrofolate synthase/folylpolyglutamate synthase